MVCHSPVAGTRFWIAALFSLLSAVPVASQSAPCPYGDEQCGAGFVWREAFPGDHVCVTAGVRDQAAKDNAVADANHVSGSEACKAGLVWRDAEPDDHVCVSGTTRTNAAADNAAAMSRRDSACSDPQSSNALDVLTLNFAGAGDILGVRYETRARRLAIWVKRHGAIPDLIAFQELYGWMYTPPWRSCGRGWAAGVGDYDEIDSILKSLLDMTGVSYRVAYMTGRVGSFSACGVYQGHALLYNPAHLINFTQTGVDSLAHDAESGLAGTPHLRRSLPLCNRGSHLMPLETLIDGPPQTDKCGISTPSGPADAVFAGGHMAATHIRFGLVGQPGKSFDVFNLHPTAGIDQEDKVAIQNLIAAHVPPPYAGSSLLYPPLLVGDLNNLNVEDISPAFITAMKIGGDEPSRIGIASADSFPTQLSVRSTRRLMIPDLPSTVDPEKPCDTALAPYLVSDHCGLFVRFDVDGVGGAQLRGVFIDGPAVVDSGTQYSLQAVPSGGGEIFTFRWTPGGATTPTVTAAAPLEGSTADWTVEVTDAGSGMVRTGHVTVRTKSQPSCQMACKTQRTACLADHNNPSWPKPTWCDREYGECIEQCAL